MGIATTEAAWRWYDSVKEEHPPGGGRMAAALQGFEAGRAAALRDSPLLVWLDQMNARVVWDGFAVGTPEEARQCRVFLRDYPVSVTAPDFITAAETARRMHEDLSAR